MEGMKDSGITWFGKVPESWELIRLKYYSYMKGRIGWQGLRADEFTEEGPYLITGTDFENGRIQFDRSYHITEQRYSEAPQIQLKTGDLLVTKDGTVGKMALVTELPDKASLNSHLLLIRPTDKYINAYLYWLMSSDVFTEYTDFAQDGTIMASLSQEKIGVFTAYVPSIKEQQAIADFLDDKCSQIDGIIADIEKQIEILKSYKKSLITETVTKGLNKNVKMKDSGVEWIGKVPKSWELIRLKYYSYMKGRIGWQGLRADEFTEEGPYLITGTDFENGRIQFDRSYHITEQRYSEAPQIQLKIGDLLVTKDGTVGKMALVTELPDKASLNSHLLLIRPTGKYINAYLYWLMSSDVFTEYTDFAQNGTIMASLSQEKIGDFTAYVPSIKEQQTIADFLDDKCKKIDSIITTKQTQLTKMQQHKKSLIYEYVTGKKRVAI